MSLIWNPFTHLALLPPQSLVPVMNLIDVAGRPKCVAIIKPQLNKGTKKAFLHQAMIGKVEVWWYFLDHFNMGFKHQWWIKNNSKIVHLQIKNKGNDLNSSLFLFEKVIAMTCHPGFMISFRMSPVLAVDSESAHYGFEKSLHVLKPSLCSPLMKTCQGIM